jgi:hypothetical protein
VNVTAIIVTRGDVDLTPILDSLPVEWERIVWDNGYHGWPHVNHYKDGNDWRPDGVPGEVHDLSVYGRYAAIQYASNDLIYVQDDDCVVSDPGRVMWHWLNQPNAQAVVCNMPPQFRYGFYEEHALVGFGAAFHRDAPEEAFSTFWEAVTLGPLGPTGTDFFNRTCDVVFTALTPRVLVDVPYEDLSWATADDRMYRQPQHLGERSKMLELAFRAKDAT